MNDSGVGLHPNPSTVPGQEPVVLCRHLTFEQNWTTIREKKFQMMLVDCHEDTNLSRTEVNKTCY